MLLLLVYTAAITALRTDLMLQSSSMVASCRVLEARRHRHPRAGKACVCAQRTHKRPVSSTNATSDRWGGRIEKRARRRPVGAAAASAATAGAQQQRRPQQRRQQQRRSAQRGASRRRGAWLPLLYFRTPSGHRNNQDRYIAIPILYPRTVIQLRWRERDPPARSLVQKLAVALLRQASNFLAASPHHPLLLEATASSCHAVVLT